MNEKQHIQTELERLPNDNGDGLIDPEEYEAVSWLLLLRELVQVVVPAVVLAFLVQFFLAQPTVVYGQSMEPNLSPHQRLIIDKVSYRLTLPERHDIVVIDLPSMEQLLVKRIIGLPGERVEIAYGIIYINNIPLDDSYSYHGMAGYTTPARQLDNHEYFVLGDNRSNSNDSRSFGPVPDTHFVGRVWLRYWPLNQLKHF